MRLLALVLSFVPIILAAQIADDFSDGDFLQNPTWEGSVTQFIVNPAGELQLNAPAAGTSFLAVRGNIPDSARWQFDVRMPFAPSATNRVRIYLMATSADLSTGNGYFFEIGENGTNDALRLFRQDAGVANLIGTGVLGAVATTVNQTVFVTRDKNGTWAVDMATVSGAPVFQFEATDATYPAGNDLYFGFYCVYTASRVDQFFFDNIRIDEDIPDNTPPLLLDAMALDATHISLLFNEALDPVSSQNTAFYDISGIGAPATATLQPDGVTVLLALPAPLSSGQNYTVTANQVQDLAGNAATLQQQTFFFFQPDQPESSDVLVNEFMSDPAPSAGLPEVEWVELYNRSSRFINANSLTLRDATSARIPLPDYVMAPGTYLVLTTAAGAGALRPFAADTVLVIALPSLNNDADEIVLERAADNLRIDRVAFASDWHTDTLKIQGGWTLERINPNLVCKGEANWQSCPVSPGGTPGAANASLDNTPDTEAPQLQTAFTQGSQSLLLRFSEELDAATAGLPSAYSLSPAVGIASATPNANDPTQVTLQLDAPLQTGVFYQLTVAASVQDCSGNGAAGPPATVVLPDVPALFDVIVTEFMADPGPNVGLPEFEWVELFNRSNKLLNLSSMTFRDETAAPVTLPNYLLAPGEYATLTTPDGAAALAGLAQNVLAFNLPSLNNSTDFLILERVTDGERIERVAYNVNWHAETGKRDGGWSLERINPGLPCLGRDNWQSCPVLPGGTPGRQNASYADAPDTTAPFLIDAFPTDAQTLELQFSEGLDAATAADPSAYAVSPGITVVDAVPDDINRNYVTLYLDAPLQTAALYQLSIAGAVQDCSGNGVANGSTTIGLPTDPAPLDVVINEVMFNPASGGARYLEMFNRSDKTFNLREFYLAELLDTLTVVKPVNLQRLFLPGQYMVLSADAADTRVRFQNIEPLNVIDMDFPTLDDKTGNVTVIWTGAGVSVTLDSFDYDEDYHNAVYSVSDLDGVALERIRVDDPTNAPANWTSASALVTGAPGTPTLPNSQAENPLATGGADRVRLLNQRLSPDGDGFEDFLEIQYDLPSTGYSGEAVIFESGGQPIRRLQRQTLLGSAGTLRWDGDTDEGVLARPGIYILYFELFDPQGNVERIKKPFALVARW
ncbi:MAG: lamin tail domain-containing protein [Saprospiraceae bacterium]|nr:lamin tail domain-containing protein [Saprospiraceae bacterium]